jgi:DNA-binding beta-propeller fold protein YncE
VAAPIRNCSGRSMSSCVRRCGAETGTILKTSHLSPAPWRDVCAGTHFSPDGSRAYVTTGSENFLDVWDLETGKRIKRVPISGHANDLAVTKDGSLVLVCIADIPGKLDIIDTTSLERVNTIPVKSGLHDIDVAADGKYAVAGSRERPFSLFFFDLRSKQLAGEMDFDQGVQL